MVSAVLLRALWAVGLFLLAIILGITGRYYFTNAQVLCERFAQGAEKMPAIVRLLSPPRFFRSRSCNAVIRVYDQDGNVVETHEHADDFKEC